MPFIRDTISIIGVFLIIKDAHGVYKKVGFDIVSRPNDWIKIRRTRLKK